MVIPNSSRADDITFWVDFDLKVIPIKQLSPVPAVDVESWLADYSPSAVQQHFAENPRNRVGAVVPEGVIGFRATSVEFDDALSGFIRSLDVSPSLWLPAGSFYRLADGENISDWAAALPDDVQVIAPGDIILVPVGEKLDRGRFGASALADLEVITIPVLGDAAADDDTPVMEVVDTPLAAMSVRGSAALFEERALQSRPLLGNVAMMGQATVWYAPPNSGKTLFMLALLLQAIENGFVPAENCYFVNADDNEAGIAQKLRLLDDVGAHTLVPGEAGFEPSAFTDQLDLMAENDLCRGVVVMLDTIKKCADLMDKRETARFASSVRRFTQKGGTFIGLAHTRKNPNANGKLVYGGTTDLTEDSDAVFMLNSPYDSASTGEKIVKFESLKKRGGGIEEAYAFAADAKNYYELLASVRLVDPDDLKQPDAGVQDQAIFDAVVACLQEAPALKMPLVAAVAARAKVSKRAALRVIEQYEAGDDGLGYWSYTVQARGAKVYSLVVNDE